MKGLSRFFATLFLITSFNLHSVCGDRVILSDQVPNDEVLRFIRSNESSLRNAMPGKQYDRIVEMLDDGRVEYYGGGRFVFKGTGKNALNVDERYFSALGEVIQDARRTAAASSATSASSSTASATTGSAASAGATTSTQSATISNTALTSHTASQAGASLPRNLARWAKEQPIAASRELTNQLNERFLSMAERYRKLPTNQRNIIVAPSARRAYEVPVNSDVGKILNTLVDNRSTGKITVQFDTNGTVQLINAKGVRRYSPETFETFLREAVRRIEGAMAAKG